ncbi:hypothetical protein ACI2K4_11220 [Micromonospora sp. NPDC050397]|uniref:hypothetical protein n=1 Tax=Micromonospora sp. NPDC050397 TaxID=3364279 RepID=UPI003850EB65
MIPGVVRVPAGTLLHLQPGEWNIAGAPAPEATTLRVVAIDGDDPRTRDGELEVWVWAHLSTCTDSYRPGHRDCYGGYVRVCAIERARAAR